MSLCSFVILLMTSIYYGTMTSSPSEELTIHFNVNDSPNEGFNFKNSDMQSEEMKAGKTFIKGKNGGQSRKARKSTGKPKKSTRKSRKPTGKPRKPTAKQPKKPPSKPSKTTDPMCSKTRKQGGGLEMDKKRKRILGGNTYYPQLWDGEEPQWERWIASLRTKTNAVLPRGEVEMRGCSGVLISKQYILTALHCVADYTTGHLFPPHNVLIFFDVVTAVSGSGEMFTAKEIKFLSDRDGKVQFYDNTKIIKKDLAAIQLHRPILPQDYLCPVKITNKALKRDSSGRGVSRGQYWMAGWGIYTFAPGVESHPRDLQYINNHPNIHCPADTKEDPIDVEKTICFGLTNQYAVCSGDSGSPGVIKMNNEWYLQGIHSRPMKAEGYATSFCNETKSIGLDINVFKYRKQIEKWIKPDKLR